MKVHRLIKMVLLIAAGVLLFVFAKPLVYDGEGKLLNGIVGSVIALYGVEGILYPILTKQVKKERIMLMSGVINIILAVVMIFLLENHPQELRTVCVLWSVWSIMRESEEIFEKCFDHWKKHPVTSLINLAESIVVIVFSLLLIVAKDHEELLEHTYAHVILLGVELIIEVIWEYAGDLESKAIERAKRRARYLKEKALAQKEAKEATNESKRRSN